MVGLFNTSSPKYLIINILGEGVPESLGSSIWEPAGGAFFTRPQNGEWVMAGRPRLPQEVAKVTGAIAKNAGRFEGRAHPKVRSLGPAPKRFNDNQKEIWDAFNANFPWLGRPDRNLVGMACLLQDAIDEGEAPIAAFAQLRLILSSMGGTPVDRSRVITPDDEDADPSDEFLN